MRKSQIALLVILIEAIVIGALAWHAISLYEGIYPQQEVTFRIADKRELGVYLKGYGLKFIYAFLVDDHGFVEVSIEDYRKYNAGDLYTWYP